MIVQDGLASFSNATMNSTEANTEYVDVEILPESVYWLLNSLMVIVTVCGMIGNGLVCFFFAKRNIRMTPFNMLLLNLSIADLLADIFAYPHIFIDLKTLRKYPAGVGDILCAFTIGVTPFGVVTYASVFTLSYISINRYVFVKFPLKAQWFKSKRNTVCFIALTWIFSICFMIPNVIAFEYDRKHAICDRIWPSDGNGYVWTATGLVLGFILPLITMLLPLIATLRHFRNQTIIKNERTFARKRGAVILLGCLILAFFVCWGPCFLYLTLSFAVESIWPPGIEGEYTRMRYIRIFFLIALLNSVTDPFIYAYRNPEFNKCFRAFFYNIRNGIRKDNIKERVNLSREVSSTSF